MGQEYDFFAVNGSTDYGVSANWTPNGPPPATGQIFIGASFSKQIAIAANDIYTADGGNICVNYGSTLTVNGKLTLALTGASIADLVDANSMLNITGSLIMAGGTGSIASLMVDGMSKVTAGPVLVGAYGTGLISVDDDSTFKSGTLTIGQTGNGSVTVSDSSTLSVATLIVGGQKATPTGDPKKPWTYSGGTGTLALSNSASVFDSGSLTLNGGTIAIYASSLDVGGQSDSKPNTLQVDSTLKGWGQIESDVAGKYTTIVGQSGPYPIYALNVTNKGTIEAASGTLKIQGDVNSDDGATKIDANATLELGGSFSGTIDFENSGTGTLVLDNPERFANGSQASVENLAPGDSIVLDNTSFANGNAVIAATIVDPNNQLELQIPLGTDSRDVGETLDIPIQGASNSILTSEYFQVTKSGANDQDTTLTLTSGNNIASAANAPTAWQSGFTGQGITVGIISNFAGTPSDIAYEKSINALPQQYKVVANGAPTLTLNSNSDTLLVYAATYLNHEEYEADSLAQVVHDIAPSAAIDAYGVGTGSVADLAQAVQALTNAGANVIVDDVGIAGESDTNSTADKQILTSIAQKNVTYVASAPNTGQNNSPGIIYGHSALPAVITVGSMNILATPTAVGNYLPNLLEPGSPGSATNGKTSDITGPDGGQVVPVGDGATIDPFFGTSSTAPAVAAVAALILSKDPQLTAASVAQLIENNAIPLGVSNGGAGLVNAAAAVAATPSPTIYFDPPSPAMPTVVSAALSQPAGDVDTGRQSN
jgi:hypothetical protein